MRIKWKYVCLIAGALMVGAGVAAWGNETLVDGVGLPTTTPPDAYYVIYSAAVGGDKEGYELAVIVTKSDDFTLDVSKEIVGDAWGNVPHEDAPALTDHYPGSPPLYASIMCGENAEELYPICLGNNVLQTVPLPSLNESVSLTVYPRTHVAVSGMIDKYDGDNSNNAGHLLLSVIKK